MTDNPNRLSKEDRHSFLSSFGSNVHNFLQASESVDDEENKTTDIEITTDLGSSTSIITPTSPIPILGRSLEGKTTPQHDPIPEDANFENVTTTSEEYQTEVPHSDTPLPQADTPLPGEHFSSTESSDDITVHHEDDSLNTEILKQMAGVKLSSSSIIRDSLENSVSNTSDNVSGSHNEDNKTLPEIVKIQDSEVDVTTSQNPEKKDPVGLSPYPFYSDDGGSKKPENPNQERNTNLIDKVSFMESSVQNNNNTLMATGASLADLPLEEELPADNMQPVTEVTSPGPRDMLEPPGVVDSKLVDEVDKILEEVRSSERGYSSDQFESPSDETDKEDDDGNDIIEGGSSHTKQLHLSPRNIGNSQLALNPLESTPIYGDRASTGAGFDLSPVIDTKRSMQLDETVSTTNPEYSQEKDMAYYLAKIKAKAAQKSLEIRSSMESSKDSSVSKSVELPKHAEVPTFVKPKTPAPTKKKPEFRKPISANKSQIKKVATTGTTKGTLRKSTPSFTKTKKVAASPVAAYIRSGVNPNSTLKNKQMLGSTWTAPVADKSLVEVIQSDGDVEAWKELYKRTQQELLQVQESLQKMETAHKERVKTLKTAQSQELHKYKQDIYVLQSKVKASTAGKLDLTTDSQIALLSKQVSELETLLAGYQTENVKLYEERKIATEHQRDEQSRMYLENQTLAADIVALKQLLEQKEATIRQLQHQQQSLTLANKVSNLPKLASLQQELEEYKKREILYKQRISVLESDGSRPEYVDSAVNSSLIAVDNQVTALVREHTAERDQLYNKLELLLKENSDLKVDKDLLKRREERISDLQQTVKTLQSSEYQQQLVSEATTENKRTISDLKRQVAELESALHKRHPDSIAALIAATQPADYSTKIIEMQQHLDKVKLEYEEHIAKLKSEKVSETEVNKVQQMNRVLKEKIIKLETETANLNTENRKLEKENRDLREGQIPTGHIKHQMDQLNEQLQIQDTEMMKLKSQLLLSQQQHHKKQYIPEQFEGRHVSEFKKEISILKTKCDLQKIDNEQQKATLSVLKVEHETEINKIIEENKLKIDNLISIHEDERQKMIAQHATRYAESEASKLKSKIETLELQVSHYSDIAGQLPSLNNELQVLRNKEKSLAEQIVKLGKELEQAQAEQPPTVQQYQTLQHKVQNLELKHTTQVSDLQNTISKLKDERVKVVIADDIIVKKLKDQIIEKNIQIEGFQNELDGIISLCMELQTHGIVLPSKHKYRS